VKLKVKKGKVFLLKAPVWSRGWVEVHFYSSMTAALEEGKWSAARPGRTLPLGNTRYPFYRRLGGPQGRSGLAENLVPTGVWSRTLRPVVSHYTDWATPSESFNYHEWHGTMKTIAFSLSSARQLFPFHLIFSEACSSKWILFHPHYVSLLVSQRFHTNS